MKFPVVVLFILLLPLPAVAARIIIDVQPEITVDERELMVYSVDLFLDTQNDTVNTVGGSLLFPPEFKLVSTSVSNAVVPLWIEQPIQSNGEPVIDFAGIIPGGYLGPHGLLFTTTFEAHSGANFLASLRDVQLFNHDGKGTSLAFSEDNVELRLRPASKPQNQALDQFPPEPFIPLIVQNNNLYGGRQVLLFQTQDKHSGIAYYEVKEGMDRHFREAQSPYVLGNPIVPRRIVVRAVDKAGNVQKAVITANPDSHSYILIIFGILIVLLVFYGTTRIRRKHTRDT